MNKSRCDVEILMNAAVLDTFLPAQEDWATP